MSDLLKKTARQAENRVIKAAVVSGATTSGGNVVSKIIHDIRNSDAPEALCTMRKVANLKQVYHRFVVMFFSYN